MNQARNNRTIVFIGLLLLVGFIYRLFLSSFAPTTLIFDMNTYHEFALAILHGKLPADCCGKNLGYSAFLAVVYYLFGKENLIALRIVQIILDLLVACLVYRISYKTFTRQVALCVFIFYIFNPFTSAYTGLRLAEIVTMLYLTLIAVVITQPKFGDRPILWIILGILLGLLLFTRFSFFYFVFGFVLLLSIFCILGKVKRLYFLTLTLMFIFIGSAYSLVANYANFRILSLRTPYTANTREARLPYAELYMNFSTTPYPELLVEFPSVDPIIAQVISDFVTIGGQIQNIKAFKAKYKVLFWQRFKTDWPLFMRNILRNIFIIWDKRFLYPYVDPFYPRDVPFLRLLNINAILFSIHGIVRYLVEEKKYALHNPLILYTISLFCYITSFFTLVSSETRHSLSFYPILLLWAGYGVFTIHKLIKKV